MRLNVSTMESLSLLCMLFLYQTQEATCASLAIQQDSQKSTNFRVPEREGTPPVNLSELIEFYPFDFPLEVQNIPVTNSEMPAGSPKIITMKLKTHLIVENNKDSNKSAKFPSQDVKIAANKSNDSNVTEDPLSDIEYVDPRIDGIYWDDWDAFKWRVHRRVPRMNSLEEENQSTTEFAEESNNSKEKELLSIFEIEDASDNSQENKTSVKKFNRSNSAEGRQFLFHPYLPYGKDVSPDEKISFHDIFPVKMVKFVKSMVEDAPWEQMFIKMVRMVVDQFVDKIIEKMFADKGGDHFKKRSIDVFLSPTWVLPTFETPVIRLKRAINSDKNPEQEEDGFGMPPPKRIPQEITEKGKKTAEERMTWLDHFLDFVFPNSKSDKSEENTSDRLTKRDTTNTQLLKMLISFFINTFEKSSGMISDAKDTLRYKMLKEFLPYLYQKRYVHSAGLSANSLDAIKMSHRKFTENLVKRNDIPDGGTLEKPERRKRSTRDHFQSEEKRLWQASSRRHKPTHHQRSRDECSLRRACNAGRLLSRLPSIHDITLQLRSYGSEPHWDALIWGMKKKRCSRIFCKRQRSPKGSRQSWNPDKERPSRNVEIVTEPPDNPLGEINNLAV